jgi:hypothetical protein
MSRATVLNVIHQEGVALTDALRTPDEEALRTGRKPPPPTPAVSSSQVKSVRWPVTP